MSLNLLTEKEVARILRITPGALRNSRLTGLGLPFIRANGRILYDQKDVEEYIQQNKYQSTTQYKASKQNIKTVL